MGCLLLPKPFTEVFVSSAVLCFTVFFSGAAGLGDYLADGLELTAFTAVFWGEGQCVYVTVVLSPRFRHSKDSFFKTSL